MEYRSSACGFSTKSTSPVFGNPTTGKDEVEVVIFNEQGKYSPPRLLVLSASAVPAPVNAPAITGNVIKIIIGDFANDGPINNSYDFAVITDATAPGESNVFIFQNYTVAGSTMGLNYRCVGHFLADIEQQDDDVIVDGDLVDADHDGMLELAIAVNTTDLFGTIGTVLFYDLAPGGSVIGEIARLRFQTPCEILDMQSIDFRRDSILADDLVVVTSSQIRDQKIGDPGEVMLRESPVGSATVRERVSQVIKGNALPHGRATVGPDP